MAVNLTLLSSLGFPLALTEMIKQNAMRTSFATFRFLSNPKNSGGKQNNKMKLAVPCFKSMACIGRSYEYDFGLAFGPCVMEPVQNYLADFFRYGGGGVAPLSVKFFWAG